MGQSNRNIEDSGAEHDLNCGCPSKEVSEKNVSMWPRDWSCHILMKNAATFCLCLKSLPDTIVRNCCLVQLDEEISKTSSIDCVMWLLVVTLMKIYKENEYSEQVKIQNV